MKLPAHRGPWGRGGQAHRWEPIPSPGLPSAMTSLRGYTAAPVAAPAPPRRLGDSGYSWSIVSLHQNNLTAEGRRHLPRRSAPWRVKVHMAPGTGSEAIVPGGLGRPVPESWSRQWLDSQTSGGEGTPSPSFSRAPHLTEDIGARGTGGKEASSPFLPPGSRCHAKSPRPQCCE